MSDFESKKKENHQNFAGNPFLRVRKIQKIQKYKKYKKYKKIQKNTKNTKNTKKIQKIRPCPMQRCVGHTA